MFHFMVLIGFLDKPTAKFIRICPDFQDVAATGKQSQTKRWTCFDKCQSKSAYQKPLWIYLQGKNRDVDVQNELADTEGEGTSGMNWENSTDIYTLSCIKDMASGKLLCSRGSSARALWWPRRVGGGLEGGSRGRGYMDTYNWFMVLSSRNNIRKQLISN